MSQALVAGRVAKLRARLATDPCLRERLAGFDLNSFALDGEEVRAESGRRWATLSRDELVLGSLDWEQKTRIAL